jgi:hypothetical protein
MDLPSSPPARQWRARSGPVIRRALPVLGGVLVLALAVVGVVVGRVDFGAAERTAISRIESETGLRVTFADRKETRFPSPRVDFGGVKISRLDGEVLVEAKAAELRFSLIDLMDGALDDPTLILRDASATLDPGQMEAPLRSPRALTELFQRISGVFDQQTVLGRLNVSIEAARITLRRTGQSGEGSTLGPLALGMSYSSRRGRIDARITQAGSGAPGGSVPLSQQQLKIAFSLPTRSALAGGKPLPATLDAALGDSRFSFSGEARGEPEVTLNGKTEATLGDTFEHLVEWQRSGREARDVSRLEAHLTLDSRAVGLDALRLSLGSKALTGIASLREVGGRWSLSATLGGDLVDGTAAHRALQGIRDAKGAWSTASLSLNPLPQLDLDLRLSTKAFRLGRFALSQVALSVLTRPNRTEMAIVDSRFGEGSFKARVNVGDAVDGGQTLRLAASGENLEGGDLLDQAFGFEHLTGTGSFVVQVQGQGRSVAALMASLNGSAALDLRNGIVNGIDLNRLMTRAVEQKAETALLFSLVGKTPFDSLRTDFAMRDGKLEPVGSRFLTRTVDAVMEGHSDIGAQQHHLSLVLRKRGENDVPRGDFFGFRLEGPLMAPALKPDSRLLQDKG